MSYTVDMMHLCVGQGLSVLITADYGEGSKRDHTFVALYDCGSSSRSQLYYENALTILADAIYSNAGVLDYVHISHFDCDHYRLFPNLAAVYSGGKKGVKIKIKNLVIGSAGNKSKEDLDDILKCFSGYGLPEHVQYFMSGRQYRVKDPYPYFIFDPPLNDVNLQLVDDRFLRINTLLYHAHLFPNPPGFTASPKGDSVVINEGSSVVLVAVVDQKDAPLASALLTGDAIRYTMRKFIEYGKYQFQNESKVITIPHHGTKIHIADDDDKTFKTLQEFLTMYPADKAVVSAKCRDKERWAHPDIMTLNCYESVAKAAGKQHQITAFEYTGGKMKVRQKTTNKQIYATFGLNTVPDGSDYADYKRATDKFSLEDIIDTWQDL